MTLKERAEEFISTMDVIADDLPDKVTALLQQVWEEGKAQGREEAAKIVEEEHCDCAGYNASHIGCDKLIANSIRALQAKEG